MSMIVYEVIESFDSICGNIDYAILGTYSDRDVAHYWCGESERIGRIQGSSCNYYVNSTIVDTTTYDELLEELCK